MADDISALLGFVNEESQERAIASIVNKLKLSSDNITHWKVLHHLLSNLKEDSKVNVKEIVAVCLLSLKQGDPRKYVRLACEVLITLVARVKQSDTEKELEIFMEDVQSNIIIQSNALQSHDNCTIDYQTATTVLSLTLPTFVKSGLLNKYEKLFEVIPAMIQSKNENSIVQALAFILPSVIHMKPMFNTVWGSIQNLFTEDENFDKVSNHLGLTALCSISDILFSDTYLSSALKDEWFLNGTRSGLSNATALNRKRAQYLLKRYVDSTNQDLSLFNDFFLIMETLEEKQMHIINPVLVKMESLEERILVKKEIDSSWLTCLYNRLLTHENAHVIKSGLHKLFRSKLEHWSGIGKSDWLYDVILTGLNNMVFYVREKSDQLPQLGEDLTTFLVKCSTLLEEREGIFIRLLGKISKIPWNAVGLFHLVYALASIPSDAFLGASALQIVLEFLRSALHTHLPILRGAIQGLTLEFVLNMTVAAQENLLWITLILATLDSRECYVRNSRLYNSLKTWICDHFTSEQLKQMLSQLLSMHFDRSDDVRTGYSVDVTTVARFAVLLLDAKIICNIEGMNEVLQRLVPLENCHTRLYADQRVLLQRMKLMATLLNEVHNLDSIQVVRLVIPFTESVILYNLEQLESAKDYHVVCECFFMLETIAKTEELRTILAGSGRRLEMMARKLLTTPSVLDKFKSVWLLSLIVQFDHQLVDELILFMISKQMHNCAPHRDDFASDHITWGSFMSHYFAQLWTLIFQRLPSLKSKLNIEQFTEEAVNAMDMAGVEAVKSILGCLELLLPHISQSNTNLCRSSLKTCWTVCFEYRRADHFWSLMERFTETAFQSSLMNQSEIRPQLFEFLSELRDQGENILQLFNFAAERVISIWIKHSFPLQDHYTVKFLVDLITFGLIHRRDEVIIFETCAFVRCLGDRSPANIHLQSEDMADGRVRFQGFRFLLSLDKRNEQHVTLAVSLLDALLSEDRQMSSKKTRYFSNSHGHRVKHRLWLALMILQDFLPPDHVKVAEVMEAALAGLVHDSPQPSVRFLLEWSAVRAISRLQALEVPFWKTMDQAVEQRAGSMVSFLSIIGHVARCLLQTGRLENFASEALPRVIPWATVQHFTPRLYGIIVMDLIWNIVETSKVTSILEQYALVRKILQNAPDMPNTQRNLEKLYQDFYFSVFHPIENFTLETLCFHLPRLSHLVSEEWLPVEWFDNIVTWIPPRNVDDRLAKCQPAEWVARAAGGAPAFTQDESNSPAMASVRNVQKKVTPWKQMLPDVNNLVVSASRKKTSTNEMIVIASLIDRVPNLGGLCRTCEVLGVRDFVISTLRVMEEKDFSSLSVSAEKWINVLEIKPFQLVDYVKQLKLDGYCVVGAEQTASSQPLNTFSFPKKTALILGHEKEGIPVDLIQHLDVCVEVPQEGIIRSMNVHVTGAIFIWEYARQQMGLPHLNKHS